MVTKSVVAMWFLTGCMLTLPLAVQAQEEDYSSPEAWRRPYRVDLELHPVGYTLSGRSLKLSSLIPMHPAGFAAERYSLLPAPVLGLGNGWELATLLSTAVPLGRSTSGIISGRPFYGLGIQKQLAGGAEFTSPALSIGGHGYTGPTSRRGGMGYLVASHRIWHKAEAPQVALFGHLGAKVESFKNNLGGDTGIRPFAGANAALSRVLFLKGEFSPRQSWETAQQFSAKATVLLFKRKYGVSFGVVGNGYRTYPSVDVVF